MLQEALARARVRCAKYVYAAREEIYWEDFVRVSPGEIEVVADPFPHVIVDEFFKPAVYASLLEEFRAAQSRGYHKDSAARGVFRKFDIDYDGYVFSPTPTLDPQIARSVFWSLEWNRFFSQLFGQYTTFETSVALHHHPPGDRTGFVHHDFTDKRFPTDVFLKNGVVPHALPDQATEGYLKRRVIALIFFLGNDGWQEGDGGETGLYASDSKTLMKKVAPINNRMLAFHIGSHSSHAFQGNLQDRNSIIQWFHAPSPDIRS